MRDRLLLGVARQAGRAAGRCGRHARAARDGAPDAGGDRDRVSAHRGERRGRAASRRVVRPGGLGVRSEPLVRSRRAGSPRRRASSARRTTRLPDEQHARDPLRPATSRPCHRDSSSARRRDAPDRRGRSRTVSSSTSATASGSTSCAAPASRSSASSSSTRRRTRETHEYYDDCDGRVGAQVAVGGAVGGSQARLTLASTSPQRRAILEQLAIPFEVVAPDYVEDDPPDADAAELVRRHAEGKARSVHRDGRITLGVDTTVVLDDRVYGKAADATRRPRGCCTSCRAGRTRSSPGSACSAPARTSSRTS